MFTVSIKTVGAIVFLHDNQYNILFLMIYQNILMHNNFKKTANAISLVSGTAIGIGIIALPMSLSKLGFVKSTILIIITWYIMYYTALVNLELNLQAGKGIPLGELGKKFGGKVSEVIGNISLKLLSYALICAYISASGSMIQELWDNIDTRHAIVLFSSMIVFLMLVPVKITVYINKILFIALVVTFIVLSLIIIGNVNFGQFSFISEFEVDNITGWSVAIPVVFTSFGFQVIFHTLTNFCDKDPKLLRRVFFWGSLIPVIFYTIWTFGVLSLLQSSLPSFYKKMTNEDVSVGELISTLSSATQWQHFKFITWMLAFLGTFTSLLGVSIGLVDGIKNYIMKIEFLRDHTIFLKLAATIAAISPPMMVVLLQPNIFVGVLGFGGIILTVIAILLPGYLFFRSLPTFEENGLHYGILKKKIPHLLAFLFAGLVVISEVMKIYF